MGKSAVKSLFRCCLVAATFALAALTLAAAFSGSVAPADSVDMPLLGMAMPVLLVVNLLVALSWALSRRKRWAWVPLAAILCNWGYLTSVFQVHLPKEKTPAGRYLKIATYNVQHFGNEITGFSCKKLARYMQQEGVDVLCFQEFGDNRYFPTDSIRRVLAHWPYFLTSGDSLRGVLPLAVFSRYPLANRRLITYRNSANSSMMCDIVTGTDTIRLINNHLQTTSISQKRKKWERELATDNARREVRAAKDAAGTLHENFMKRATQTYVISHYVKSSPHPVLVCGDFNSIPSSYTYHHLRKMLKDGFRTAGNGYMYTYRYAKRMMRIDYIFHSPCLKGIDYYSPDMELCSDHNPVIMEVEM